jgi:hypothetical protein
MRNSRLYFALLPLVSLAHANAQASAAAKVILEGDVINAATGAPIAGARVKLDPRQAEPRYLKSDDAGHFLFRNLAPGEYLWTVEAPGFLRPPQNILLDLTVQPGPVCYAPGSAPASTSTVTRSADADGTLHARISIPLTASAVITGTVTDPDGIPLENWSVSVLVKQPVPKTGSSGSFARPLPEGHYEVIPKSTVQTNDKGAFRAGRLEPGSYYLIANRPTLPGTTESTYRATYFPRGIDLASAKPLELGAGGQVRADIRIVSQHGIRVAGRLVKPASADEFPAGSLFFTQIDLVEENDFPGANGMIANGQDDYEFDDVLPGRYTVIALTHSASGVLSGEQKAVFGLMQSIEAGDADRSDADLVLQPLRDLAGAVTFQEGCTPFPVTVSAQSFSPLSGGRKETVSGSDGRFVLGGLGTGNYTVTVASSGRIVRARSIRLGDRDVQKDGFESPLAGDEPLLIDVACGNSRRPR